MSLDLQKPPTTRTSPFRKREEVYEACKKQFLDGGTIRSIAKKQGLEPFELLQLIRYIGKEFRVERAVRTDQALMKIMRAQDTAVEAALASTDNHKLRADLLAEAAGWGRLFLQMSRENDRHLAALKIRHKPGKSKAPEAKMDPDGIRTSIEDYLPDEDPDTADQLQDPVDPGALAK